MPHAIFGKGVLLASLAAFAAAPAGAQDCRSSSYIPGLNPLILTHASGQTIALQRDSKNYAPSVHIWMNGQYFGEYPVPVSLAEGEIQVLLRMGQRLETWMGSVRQAQKAIPYVVVCGPCAAGQKANSIGGRWGAVARPP